MTTQEFTRALIKTLTERMTNRLIELAEESIAKGIEEYIEKGYITLDFNGEVDKIKDELLSKGLEYYDYRWIFDTAWAEMTIHLRNEGWEFELIEIDGKFKSIVKMPSKLIVE